VTVRIGVVGAGFIAWRHVEALSALDGVTGVADPRTDRTEVLATDAEALATHRPVTAAADGGTVEPA
jgi:myo-inositol 2-dehydrogenase / D-chiro-inositol 1-dehydrogenase